MENGANRRATFIALFLGALWAVYLLDLMLPAEFIAYGLQPRTARGLWGIVTAPFLHANLTHLLANTVSLAVLLALLFVFHGPRLIEAVLVIVVLSGGLLWIFGRSAIHVGASGLIYGLATFLICAGFVRKRPVEVIGSVIVIAMYGSSLLFGVLPSQPGVSWDGHLAGAAAGGLTALGSSEARRTGNN